MDSECKQAFEALHSLVLTVFCNLKFGMRRTAEPSVSLPNAAAVIPRETQSPLKFFSINLAAIDSVAALDSQAGPNICDDYFCARAQSRERDGYTHQSTCL